MKGLSITLIGHGGVARLQRLRYVRAYMNFSLFPTIFFKHIVVVQCALLCCRNMNFHRFTKYVLCLPKLNF
jgi:hypothetical protein